MDRLDRNVAKSHTPNGANPNIRRLKLSFMGEVQGVGFRWTAQRVARDVGTTGWVKNEYDGSVSMELQGTDAQIAAFFGGFNHAYSRWPIDYVIVDKDEIDVVKGENEFRVRF